MALSLAIAAQRALAAALLLAATQSCAKPDAGPREDVWSMAAVGNCRTMSAGWGAPADAAQAMIGGAYKPIAIDRMGGAPVFLFFHHCDDASVNGSATGPFTFAALYVYARPVSEIPAAYALERGNGQALAFLAGDPQAPVIAAYARHGAIVHDAQVTITESTAPDGVALVGEIAFPVGKIIVEEVYREDTAGDDFTGKYDAAGTARGRFARFHGEERLARKNARRVSVTVEGTTPFAGLGLPAARYMSGLGEGIASEVVLSSEPAPAFE